MKPKPMVTHTILPNATDPAITLFTGSPHYCYVPVTPSGYLHLFFCGSGAQPGGATAWLEESQSAGHHTIGLMYPDSPYPGKPNCNLVSGQSNYMDLFCEEVFYGEELSPLTSINVANSISNRIEKLLQYLMANYPTEGWDQFFSDVNDYYVDWSKLITSGHSQGGDHAWYIWKTFPQIKRLITLSSPRKVCPTVPADFSGGDATKAYVFSHLSDNFTEEDANVRSMGITAPYIDTWVNTDPTQWGQYLVTSAPSPSPNSHKCTISDSRLKPVWTNLLTVNT